MAERCNCHLNLGSDQQMSPQVTNHPELHEYSARQTLEALKRGANHDAMVGAAAAIVGAPPEPRTSLRAGGCCSPCLAAPCRKRLPLPLCLLASQYLPSSCSAIHDTSPAHASRHTNL
jgi:hypothetical protein